MTKLQITVTKEHLRLSKMCGTNLSLLPSENCAIAYAVKDIFPNATVGYANIIVDGHKIPHNQMHFILEFDNLKCKPEERLAIPETTFTVELPDVIIDMINIDDINKAEHLNLIYEQAEV